MILGLLGSFVAFISYERALKAQLKPYELFSGQIVKSQLYYVAHTIEDILLIAAGLVALFRTDWRKIERGYTFRFALLLAAALLMTVRGYSVDQLLSTKIADFSGPVPFLLSLLVFVGARRGNWRVIETVMAVMALLFCGLVAVGIAGLRNFTRQEAIASLGGTVAALYWPAAWIALREYPRGSLARRLRFVPVAIYGLGSLFTQTRLLFVMLLGLLALYVYFQHKRRTLNAAAWIAALLVFVWAGLFTAVFLLDTRAFQRTETVTAAFWSRLDEDTRTGQLRSFAESVRPEELVLGRGALGSWMWQRAVWGGGTDVGYLTLLFYGGLPLLITYVASHVTPCLRVFRTGSHNWQVTPAALGLLWGINLFSSAFPGQNIQYYLILLCVGACINRELVRESALRMPRRGGPIRYRMQRREHMQGRGV